MEQLSLFEHAGVDADTGFPAATYTKQELIAYYKQAVENHYKYKLYSGMDVSATDFLSFVLKQKP